jgi:hypothetical protein
LVRDIGSAPLSGVSVDVKLFAPARKAALPSNRIAIAVGVHASSSAITASGDGYAGATSSTSGCSQATKPKPIIRIRNNANFLIIELFIG